MIYIIGGAPLLGKTTVAQELSYKYKIPFISTDDICTIFCKAINYSIFGQRKYFDYFTECSIEEIIEDYEKFQKNIEPVISQYIKIKIMCEESIIIEGFNMEPQYFDSLFSDDIKAVWLISSDNLLFQRLNDIEYISKKSKNKDKFMLNYIRKLLYHNDSNIKQCKKKNYSTILVDNLTVDEIISEIKEVFCLDR